MAGGDLEEAEQAKVHAMPDADENADEVDLSAEQGQDQLPPVDGWRAWVVVFGSFLAHFGSLGVVYSFSLFIKPYQEQFQVSRAEIAWIFQLQSGLLMLCGIIAGRLADQYGVRLVVLFGTVLLAVGHLLASFATSFWQVIVCQGMVAGVGISFVYWPSVTVVPQWFDKHRGSATGFAVLGAGIGNLASGALIGLLLTEEPDENSTRDALRGLALYCTVTLLFAIACMTRRLPAVPKKGMLRDSKEMLRNRTFIIMAAGAFFFGSAYTIPFSTIAAFAEDAGNDVQFSAILIGAIGIGSSVGRIALGLSADALGRLKTFKLSMAFTAMACSLWWFSRSSQEALLVFGAMFGFFSGGFISLVPVVVSEYFSPAKLGSIMGSISLFMVPGGFLGPFIAGVFYDQSGSYKAACIYTGVVISFSAIIFALLSPPSKVASHNTTT